VPPLLVTGVVIDPVELAAADHSVARLVFLAESRANPRQGLRAAGSQLLVLHW